MEIGKLATMIFAGSGILIGIYLIVSNPTGTSKATNSLSSAFTSGVKALQAR